MLNGLKLQCLPTYYPLRFPLLTDKAFQDAIQGPLCSCGNVFTCTIACCFVTSSIPHVLAFRLSGLLVSLVCKSSSTWSVLYWQTRPWLILSSFITFTVFHYHMIFLQEKSFLRFPDGCWQWCVVAGLTPARRSCNIISYWFLVDLPWSSHHSVMCSTRLLNEINSPPAKQKSNRTLWELSAVTEWVWWTFVG